KISSRKQHSLAPATHPRSFRGLKTWQRRPNKASSIISGDLADSFSVISTPERIGPKSNIRLRRDFSACAKYSAPLLRHIKPQQTPSHGYEIQNDVPRFERHLRHFSFIDSRAPRRRCS